MNTIVKLKHLLLAGALTVGPTAFTQTTPSDRDYYQQLYDAGGFSEPLHVLNADGSPAKDESKVMIGNADYVCFNDNAHSGTFFTFVADAYDNNYRDAQEQILNHSANAEGLEKQFNILQAIQQKAPYVRFMTSDVLNVFPPDAQQFYRNGGRTLDETIYEKGVKTGKTQYQWDGNGWFFPTKTSDPKAYTQTSTIFRLSIEPKTLRYVESTSVTITVGSGDTAATGTTRYGPWGGVCEAVPTPK